MLLQTLDYDGDPTNGIRITPDVADLFVGETLDFEQKWSDFDNDSGFRGILNEANTRGLLSDHRAVRNAGFAMRHVYETMGFVRACSARTVEAIDTDADGTVDQSVVYVHAADGTRTRLEWDEDSVTDEFIAKSFNGLGWQTGEQRDLDGDGTPDEVATISYDADGTIDRRTQYTSEADGWWVALWGGLGSAVALGG